MKECNLLQTYEIFLKLIYLKLLQEYWTYKWDLWNRLIEVKQHNAPENGECVEVSYEYDAFNHRIKRTSYDEDNKEREVTKYAYGRNGALAYQEKTKDGSVTKRSFAYLNNEIIGFTDKLGEEESVYYTVTDIQGSITEVYDGSSNLVWKSGYTAFGELANTIFNGTTTSGQVGNLFTGTMANFNVNQPKWAGSVGVVGENIIPTMIDIKNNLEGN